jgi:hypothetical protein
VPAVTEVDGVGAGVGAIVGAGGGADVDASVGASVGMGVGELHAIARRSADHVVTLTKLRIPITSWLPPKIERHNPALNFRDSTRIRSTENIASSPSSSPML